MRKKILIIPVQVGLAHLIRSIAIAEELKNKHDVYLTLDNRKKHLFTTNKITIIPIEEIGIEGVIEMFDALKNKEKARIMIDRYTNIIYKIKPDLIINNFSPAGMAAAWLLNTKQVLIMNSDILPFTSGFPGFFSKPTNFIQKIISWPIGLFLDWWKRHYIGMVTDLVKLYDKKSLTIDQALSSIPIIIPEIIEYNHLKKYLPNFHFVGPIVCKNIEAKDTIFEKKIIKKAHGKKIIYVTFGGTGFGKNVLKRLVEKLVQKGYFVILATGIIIEVKELKHITNNLYIKRFVPGFSACHVADIIVSHGSYGTVTQALYCGKPIIIIPFNLDQMFHALKVQELKVGKGLITIRPLHFFMDWKAQQKTAENLNPKKVIDAIEEVITDKKYKNNAENFSSKLKNLNGAQKAAKIIENCLN
ncbi:MAG: glycosyltransferase [bacterium]|nr:glycosyltransferase [bacterium]